ncbi:MAG: ParB/RepB/Spo0J family partition protein [Candidatus Aenigmatarchaeota archaeon]
MKIYNVVELDLDIIENDESNPNVMTESEEKRLEYSFEKFGFLQPVVVAKLGDRYIYADGEHRAKIYKKFGRKTIPAIIVEVQNDAERRLIRQAMNKIRGVHNPQLDIQEFKFIEEQGFKEDLIRILDINDLEITNKLEDINIIITSENNKRYNLTFHFDNKEDRDKAYEFFKQNNTKELDTKKLLELIIKE